MVGIPKSDLPLVCPRDRGRVIFMHGHCVASMDGTQDRRRLVGRQEVPGISIFGDHPATGVRRRKGALAACLACVLPAAAQLTVEVDLQQQQFLPGESLPVAVRITNLSGQPLRLGEEEDWLSFSVEAEDQRVVRRFGEPVLREPFRLESSQRATVRVDLAPYYDLSRQGRYRVQATVRVLAWDREFSSLPVDFFIITGARLWEREFGLPGSDAGRPPEMRKYILQEANYLKRNLRLYLRITDPTETQIIRVVPLGPIVSFGQPQPQLDSASNLHLLFQNGRSTFVYHVINPDGEIMVRETYEIAGSRPRLGMDATGRITVVGGQRRYAADDVPPSLSGRGPRAVGQDDSPRRASDD